MLFDRLCGIAEKWLPELTPMLKKARIFKVPPLDANNATELSGLLADLHQRELLTENFRLPFEVVAFESAASVTAIGQLCVMEEIDAQQRIYNVVLFNGNLLGLAHAAAKQILPDGKGAESGITESHMSCVGLAKSRMFWVEAGQVRAEPWKVTKLPTDEFRDDLLSRAEALRHKYEAAKARGDYVSADAHFTEANNVAGMVASDMLFSIVSFGIGYTLLVNAPSQFIVEVRPRNLKEVKNPRHLLRSSHRPHYIVLKPKEIKTKLLGLSEEEAAGDTIDEHGRKVRPHERRGHFRKLTSEHFKAARGKIIWIDALWVGPQTGIQGKNRYTVLLDK